MGAVFFLEENVSPSQSALFSLNEGRILIDIGKGLFCMRYGAHSVEAKTGKAVYDGVETKEANCGEGRSYLAVEAFILSPPPLQI